MGSTRFTWKVWLFFNAFLSLSLFLRAGVNRTSVGIVAGGALILMIPLFFETRDANAEPSRVERVAAGAWLWFRRLLGFGAAALFGFGAIFAATTVEATMQNFGMIAFMLVLAFICGWVGMYGGGRRRGMGREDIQVHEEHKRRYRWRW